MQLIKNSIEKRARAEAKMTHPAGNVVVAEPRARLLEGIAPSCRH
jgi:hypothetical protein